jgi:hypothetical protein
MGPFWLAVYLCACSGPRVICPGESYTMRKGESVIVNPPTCYRYTEPPTGRERVALVGYGR